MPSMFLNIPNRIVSTLNFVFSQDQILEYFYSLWFLKGEGVGGGLL